MDRESRRSGPVVLDPLERLYLVLLLSTLLFSVAWEVGGSLFGMRRGAGMTAGAGAGVSSRRGPSDAREPLALVRDGSLDPLVLRWLRGLERNGGIGRDKEYGVHMTMGPPEEPAAEEGRSMEMVVRGMYSGGYELEFMDHGRGSVTLSTDKDGRVLTLSGCNAYKSLDRRMEALESWIPELVRRALSSRSAQSDTAGSQSGPGR